MCFESTDSKFDSITGVDIGGDELIIGLPIAFNEFLVDSSGLVVHDLELEFVAADCHPFHYIYFTPRYGVCYCAFYRQRIELCWIHNGMLS